MPTTKCTPGCYIDSHHGHHSVPALIQFAHGYGFPLDPFAEFTLNVYGTHYYREDYPTGAMDELANEAEQWLNDHERLPGHWWGWQEGDFGLYPHECEGHPAGPNPGCDKCGTYDRVKGSAFCVHCT